MAYGVNPTMINPNNPYAVDIADATLDSGVDFYGMEDELAQQRERIRQLRLAGPAGGGVPGNVNRAARGILAGYNERGEREKTGELGKAYKDVLLQARKKRENPMLDEMSPGQYSVSDPRYG